MCLGIQIDLTLQINSVAKKKNNSNLIAIYFIHSVNHINLLFIINNIHYSLKNLYIQTI